MHGHKVMCLFYPRLHLATKYVCKSQKDSLKETMTTTNPKPGVTPENKPLLPISDLLYVDNDVSKTVSSISNKMDRAVTDGLQKVKETEHERVKKVIMEEIDQLAQKQDKTNEEIKRRVAELQSLRESNLVVAGAVSGLRKILNEVSG